MLTAVMLSAAMLKSMTTATEILITFVLILFISKHLLVSAGYRIALNPHKIKDFNHFVNKLIAIRQICLSSMVNSVRIADDNKPLFFK